MEEVEKTHSGAPTTAAAAAASTQTGSGEGGGEVVTKKNEATHNNSQQQPTPLPLQSQPATHPSAAQPEEVEIPASLVEETGDGKHKKSSNTLTGSSLSTAQVPSSSNYAPLSSSSSSSYPTPLSQVTHQPAFDTVDTTNNATTSATTTKNKKKKKKKKRWTDTNSDQHCIQQVQNPFARLGYSISLATGFYAIEPLDKRLSVALGYALLVIFVLLIYVFYRGVRDGFAASSSAALETATVLLTTTTPQQDQQQDLTMIMTMSETVEADGMEAVGGMVEETLAVGTEL